MQDPCAIIEKHAAAQFEIRLPSKARAMSCHPSAGRRAGSRRVRVLPAALAAIFLLGSTASMAALVTFDFNSVALGVSNPNNPSNGLGITVGSSTAIANFMNTKLPSGSTVAVSGALATAKYNGEGHVVGDTLGTSDGGVHHNGSPDIFIINNNFAIGASASDQFSMMFTNYTITALSFDWEIFPDNTCSKSTNCGKYGQTSNSNWPDIELFVNNESTARWGMLATFVPGQDPQGMGTASVDLSSVSGGVTKLRFVDWPAEIGIDNLQVTGCVGTNGCAVIRLNNVPEPSTLPLAALALAALTYGARRARGRATGGSAS